MASDPTIPSEAAPVMHELARGMNLKKCRKCGCMADAIDSAARIFQIAEEPAVRALAPVIEGYKARMDPLAYDCIGCRKCWGADAMKLLIEGFGDLETEGAGCCAAASDPPVAQLQDFSKRTWPPYPGEYLLGNLQGSVAVCTLSSRDLAVQVVEQRDPSIAIAGRCDTENIGVEKVVLNLIANPRIRWLVLCGREADGHRAGDAFLSLKERGVDAGMRVLETASWRPVLKNLTLKDVARFREQVEVVNLVGVTDIEVILQAARECGSRTVPPLSDSAADAPSFERIQARAPKRLKLDPAGFFILLPQFEKGMIICEHYTNDGRLTHVIEGRRASLIAATAVERGLISQLDHAAYLGRELAKAELALATGAVYEQDAALGSLPPEAAADPEESSCCPLPPTAT